jgi:hypothetical protein
VVGQRAHELPSDTVAPMLGQDARGDEGALTEVRRRHDPAARECPLPLGEQQQTPGLIRRSELLGGDRLVRDDPALQQRPRVEVGRRRHDA